MVFWCKILLIYLSSFPEKKQIKASPYVLVLNAYVQLVKELGFPAATDRKLELGMHIYRSVEFINIFEEYSNLTCSALNFLAINMYIPTVILPIAPHMHDPMYMILSYTNVTDTCRCRVQSIIQTDSHKLQNNTTDTINTIYYPTFIAKWTQRVWRSPPESHWCPHSFRGHYILFQGPRWVLSCEVGN